jgi:hypothetical protein
VLFLFAGFLVSIEAFREIRVPFTTIVLRRARREPDGAPSARWRAVVSGGQRGRSGGRIGLTFG